MPAVTADRTSYADNASGAAFHVAAGYRIVIFFYPYTTITIGFNILKMNKEL